MKAEFTIGVFGMIFDEQKRVLLCHRRDFDLWNLPGGGMEHGESPIEGVIREVKEETGLTVEIVKLVGIYTKPKTKDLVFSFICKPIDGKITLNEEADKVEYFKVDDIPSNTSGKQAERIQDALLDLPVVIFKSQYDKSSIELIKEGKL